MNIMNKIRSWIRPEWVSMNDFRLSLRAKSINAFQQRTRKESLRNLMNGDR